MSKPDILNDIQYQIIVSYYKTFVLLNNIKVFYYKTITLLIFHFPDKAPLKIFFFVF